MLNFLMQYPRIGFFVAMAFVVAVNASLLKGLVAGDISPREAVGGSLAGGMFLALCA